mmetsp:Transcript_12953/g.29823  ORF Transcript_12953/g.29823 Transcript_12953/m.29823 type:complete len:218 (+) Transcript_12953:698-1351(+)
MHDPGHQNGLIRSNLPRLSHERARQESGGGVDRRVCHNELVRRCVRHRQHHARARDAAHRCRRDAVSQSRALVERAGEVGRSVRVQEHEVLEPPGAEVAHVSEPLAAGKLLESPHAEAAYRLPRILDKVHLVHARGLCGAGARLKCRPRDIRARPVRARVRMWLEGRASRQRLVDHRLRLSRGRGLQRHLPDLRHCVERMRWRRSPWQPPPCHLGGG